MQELFSESIKNSISSLMWATIFDVGLQRDRDILEYIVGILKYIKVYQNREKSYILIYFNMVLWVIKFTCHEIKNGPFYDHRPLY